MHKEGVRYRYVSKFINEDMKNAIFFCQRFINGNESIFKTKEPADYVYEILEKIFEGKRKCYMNTYNNFRGSVYYHLKNAMINWLRVHKKEMPVIDVYDEPEDNDEEVNCRNRGIPVFTGCDDILRNIDGKELRSKLFKLFNKKTEKNEISLLENILDGKSNMEAAEEMNLSVRQVENAKKRIFRRIYNRFDKKFLKEILTCEEAKQLKTF